MNPDPCCRLRTGPAAHRSAHRHYDLRSPPSSRSPTAERPSGVIPVRAVESRSDAVVFDWVAWRPEQGRGYPTKANWLAYMKTPPMRRITERGSLEIQAYDVGLAS